MTITETEAAVNAGLLAANPVPLNESDRFHVITVPDGGHLEVIDLVDRARHLAPRPLRKTGTYRLTDAASLIDYVNRHGSPDTELWHDQTNFAVKAVLNGNGTAEPGHGDHVAVLTLVKTPEWKAWEGLDRKTMSQTQFAEHIEDHLRQIADPAGAELLDLVTTLKVAKSAEFEAATRLSTGEIAFGYRETQTATAGAKGQLTIPEVFTLGLTPFQGSQGYKVTARLRYRMSEGNLSLSYVLDQPEAILEAAFDDVVSTIADDLVGYPLLAGWPNR